MNIPPGRLQFFALEAGDYLERLALIVGRPVPPDGEELVRLTRALRGASLMAGLPEYSQGAAALEQIAKAYRTGQWDWSPARIEVFADAVEEFKRLTRRAGDWNEADAGRASKLSSDLMGALQKEGLAAAEPTARPVSDELQPSVRVFVGREGALIAGTIEHAAQAVELGTAGETADVVLQRLQPLRGLAALPTLSPLPEFLDIIEMAMRMVRDGTSPPNGAMALRQLAAAVTHVAREIADHGRAAADSAAAVGGARAVLATFGSETDVVEIRTLFRVGDSAPIVSRGSPPAREVGDGTIELVGLADRLRHAADQIATTESVTGRLLHLFALVIQVRPLLRDASTERPGLRPFLHAAETAIAGGRAEAAPTRFADLLREAADRLARAAEARDAVFLGDDLADVAAGLRLDDVAVAEPPGSAPAPLAPEPRGEATPETPVELLPIVPIESLAPSPPQAAPFGMTAFETSFSTYHRLTVTPKPKPTPVPTPAPIELPRIVPAELAAPASIPLDAGVVPIESLFYRGRRALERADVVRLELSAVLKAQSSFEVIQPLVSELIDLVPLALAE